MARTAPTKAVTDAAAAATAAGLPDPASTDNGIAGDPTPTVPAGQPSLAPDGMGNLTDDGPDEGPAEVEMTNPFSPEGSRTFVPEGAVADLEASGWRRAGKSR